MAFHPVWSNLRLVLIFSSLNISYQFFVMTHFWSLWNPHFLVYFFVRLLVHIFPLTPFINVKLRDIKASVCSCLCAFEIMVITILRYILVLSPSSSICHSFSVLRYSRLSLFLEEGVLSVQWIWWTLSPPFHNYVLALSSSLVHTHGNWNVPNKTVTFSL